MFRPKAEGNGLRLPAEFPAPVREAPRLDTALDRTQTPRLEGALGNGKGSTDEAANFSSVAPGATRKNLASTLRKAWIGANATQGV